MTLSVVEQTVTNLVLLHNTFVCASKTFWLKCASKPKCLVSLSWLYTWAVGTAKLFYAI